MTVERRLIISVLKLTKDGTASIEHVKKESRMSSHTMVDLLEKLQAENLLKTNDDSISADSENRLRLALKAVLLGADVEVVSSYLQWQEFESITATALKNNGYVVQQNVRFKHEARKWEIDVVGCRKPLAVCVDCKHWHKALSPFSMKRIVEAQVERTRALADTLPNVKMELECGRWDRAKFVPFVMVLMSSRFKFYDNTPIVSVLQLQDFLYQLPLEVENLKYFLKEFAHLSNDFQQRRPSKP